MIANITKGKRAQGALIYDFGPGRKDEHVNARFIGGNVPGTRQQVARIIDHHTRQGELTRPLWRCSLSLPDEDGVLPDATWSQMATRFVEEMGFGDCPWVAVRHGDDHIHLTVSRLAWDGSTASDQWDFARARKVADALEEDFGLVAARTRFREAGPGVRSGSELAASVRRGQDQPERLQLRDLVRAARTVAAGQGREVFERELDAAGVQHRANVASTGRMNGYSFSLSGWTSDSGQVWVTASSMAKDLGWKQLGPVLGDGGGTAVAQLAAAPAPRPESDLARRTLDAYRNRPEPVEAGPQVPPLDQRRYGRLDMVELTLARDAARADIPRHQQTAAASAAVVEHLVAMEAGQVEGTVYADLRTKRLALDEATRHLDEATRHSKTMDDARKLAVAARKVGQQAEAKAQKGKVALGLLGTTKRQQLDYASAAFKESHAADAKWRAADTARKAEQDAATALFDGDDPAAEAAAMDANWPQLQHQAVAADRAAASAALPAAREKAAADLARLQAAQTRLDAIQAEGQLRTTFSPEYAEAERMERINAALERRAAGARATSPSRAKAKGTKPPKPARPSGVGQPQRRPGQEPGRGSGLGR